MLRRHGADRDGMTIAVILLVASTARWRAQHDGWDGEIERQLALDALHDNHRAFERAATRAAKIVAENWQAIVTEN
jgi:hypothetical protein